MLLSPLTQVHFQLSGGWRQNALIASVYVALLVLIASMAYGTTAPADHGSVSSTLLTITGVVQAAFVLLIAPGAVRRAVQRDFQTGMIESHRLTPLSALNLVTGYLTGPTLQAALLFVVGFIVGSYFAGMTGQSYGFPGVAISSWGVSQLALLPLALLLAALVLLCSLASAGKTSIMPILVAFGILGGWIVIPVVPGLALLMGVMNAGLVLKWFGAPIPTTAGIDVTACGMVVQTGFAILLIRACCRKIRAPEQPAFSIPLGLGLLGAAGITLVVGWHYYQDFVAVFGWGRSSVQWVGSTVTFMVVALFPLVAAAEMRHRRTRAALAAGKRPPLVMEVDSMPVLLTAATAIVAIAMSPVDWSGRLDADLLRAWGVPVLAFALSFWTDYAWVCFVLARRQRVFRALVVGWIVLKGLPVAMDGLAALTGAMLQHDEPIVWHLAGFSPVGTLIMLALNLSIWPGLAIQLVLAALATALFNRQRNEIQGDGAIRV